jgi:uncharacterized hydrophobic protein (TIGR00271 family)
MESTAVVVGSMVIAPLVGPVLTAAVGAVTTDREMLLDSIWIQAGGLAIAIVGAITFSFGLKLAGFFPSTLDIASIDLIALRIAPNFVTVVIGLAAGAAGAFGLMTKGPTTLIGVMIAAALIPAAATVGIATAWNEYRIAIGSLLLLLFSVIMINAGAYTVLRHYYRSGRDSRRVRSRSSLSRLVVIGTVLAVVGIVAIVGGASAQQIGFERTVNGDIHEALNGSEEESMGLVTVRIEYADGPVGSPETVTAIVSRRSNGTDPPNLANEIHRRISETTGREVTVRVLFKEYQRSETSSPS